MTPTQVETAARRKYNAVGSGFYGQDELFDIMTHAVNEALHEANMVVEAVDSSQTSTASTQSYSFPTDFTSIKRIEFNGEKLKRIDFREDDALTLQDSDTTDTGTPQYYFVWNETYYLRPIPDTSSLTIKVFGYKRQPRITSDSVSIVLPEQFHMDLTNKLASEMAAKDDNFQMARHYAELWSLDKVRMRKWAQKRKRGDSFAIVKDEEALAVTLLGAL